MLAAASSFASFVIVDLLKWKYTFFNSFSTSVATWLWLSFFTGHPLFSTGPEQ
jgi:hypothetical protein